MCSPTLVFSLDEKVVGELYVACQDSSAASCTHSLSVETSEMWMSLVSVIRQTVACLSCPSSHHKL